MISQTSPTEYQKLKEILADALEIDDADERAGFLCAACAGDEHLLAEIESLLAENEKSDVFLENISAANVLQHSLRNTDAATGEKIGSYRIEREIGRGGMGVVYLATRSAGDFQKRAAIKLIKQGGNSDETFRRFRQERQILAALEHPNIARLLDGGTTEDGTPYLVMEYVEGVSIDEFCANRNLSVTEKLDLFRKICAAVAHAHRNLTIHRDLKAANILVTGEGEPKLLDFGIAKLFSIESNQKNNETLTHFRALTPEYASPEQLRGEKLTTATDVYSLGVILYELLTGKRPFTTGGKTFAEVLRIVSEIQPTRPSSATKSDFLLTHQSKIQPARRINSLDSDIDKIVLKALAKEPERRYGSVEQFSEDIGRYLKGLPVSARKDSFSYRVAKLIKRNTIASAVSALLILSLIGGFIITFRQYQKAQIAQARAEQRFNDVRTLAHSLVFELNEDIEKGPTRARQKLVAKALEYLDSLSREAQTDEDLKREIGETYLQIGDIQGRAGHANLGDADGALQSYRKAIAILEPLAQANSQNQTILVSLSFAYENTGKLQMLGSEFATAIATHQKALKIRQKLLDVSPDDIKYRRYVAESLIRIGDALSKVAELTENIETYPQILENYQKALQTFEEIAALEPSNITYQTWQPTLRQRIGTLLETWGKLTGDAEKLRSAVENHRQSLTFWQRLSAAAPEDEGIRTQIADEMTFIGMAQTDLGELKNAFENFQQAKVIFESIASKDKENKEIFYDFVFFYQNLAVALAQNGETAKAIKTHRQALQIAENLLTENPARNNEIYGFMLTGQHALSHLTEMQHNPAQSLAASRREFEIRAKILQTAPFKTKLEEPQKVTAERIKYFENNASAGKKVENISH